MGLTLARRAAPCLLAAALLSAAIQAAPPPRRPAQPAALPVPTGINERLMALFADDSRREDGLDPLGQLSRGERVEPADMALLFTDTLSRRRLASARRSLDGLAAIDRALLTPERQVSYDAFAWQKREELSWLQPDMRAVAEVLPLNHFDGLHSELPALLARGGAVPYDSVADYRNALALQKALGQVFGQAILRMREGMASGVVAPKLTVRNMIGQIDALLAQKVTDSPFYSPATDFPKAMPEATRAALRADYAATIRGEVYPAYRRLRTFLAREYLPAARDSVGLAQMKGGAALYRLEVRDNTTLAIDPAEVHQLGLGEVARIQREMAEVQRQLGYAGPLRAFFDTIRTDPRFHPKTREELAEGFARVSLEVDRLVPQYFARVPRTKLLIQPYPAYREKYEAGGSYNQGSSDATRPGIFFYNTYDLPSRFLSGITTLYLHEAIPGHHFQVSLAQEDTSLPDFQRFGGNTAYVEGWALYAETLGYAMGLYADPMQHWGTLDDEMLRAMRLVVDTGLHTMGWSRDQAIDYMLANSGMGRTDATAEVERYIAIPGQALAYKIGALTIQRLRARAESELGSRFDIRAFHQQVLGSGALPLTVLEAKIDRWIAARKAQAAPPVSPPAPPGAAASAPQSPA
ncbi:DUF885 domain-containing protein [Novosphingobium flavum]|uniref:DUF885 domain-containing protein n=1 Tax=Novosphingobium flavum TaxID=1778672 RepID=A0A7X1FRB8_9SPHN|nr:DUF885 domain-containing protein [Novosphingobium flavum]MBC2664957.1 DUF885 domain-containing protein [Novosphingobium flavum]